MKKLSLMKDANKVGLSKIETAKLTHLKGGDSGCTCDTYSVCHIDGVTDDDCGSSGSTHMNFDGGF